MHRNIVLPNLVTLLGMLAGMFALVSVMNGRFIVGAWAILLAAVFDGLDGKVARLVNGASEFGVQLDSLADVVSFGVAPAVLVYHWQFIPHKQLGMMVMFLYVACSALRLARFNVQTKRISNVFFMGLPVPAAAAVIASSVLFIHHLKITDNALLSNISLGMVVLLAFLMVSTIPYFSFKKFRFGIRQFYIIFFVVLIIFLIGLQPFIGIFTCLMLYILSGFIMIPFRARATAYLEKTGKKPAIPAAKKEGE
jgi:CDP-diacylglycerol--serine O-phosphatidyltransferase